MAVENYPGHGGLSAFEQSFDGSVAIGWSDVLLPKDQAGTITAADELTAGISAASPSKRRFSRSMKPYLQWRKRRKPSS